MRYYSNANLGGTTQSNTTDQEGKYEFGCGEAGEGIVTAAAADLAPAMQSIRVAEKMGPTDLQLGEGKPMKVRVVGPDHTPLADVFVGLWNWDEHAIYGNLTDCRGKTDDKGNWEWRHAPSGVLSFAYRPRGMCIKVARN